MPCAESVNELGPLAVTGRLPKSARSRADAICVGGAPRGHTELAREMLPGSGSASVFTPLAAACEKAQRRAVAVLRTLDERKKAVYAPPAINNSDRRALGERG